MKNNRRSGINIIDITVVLAIIVIFCVLMMSYVPNPKTKHIDNCLCVKTFEQTNWRYSELVVVFEKNPNTYVLLCNTALYALVQENKYYDIEYAEVYSSAFGYNGRLVSAVKVYQSQKDK